MGISRAHALERIAGLSAHVEAHLAKMRSAPHAIDYNHWRAEAEAEVATASIEALARHVGRRTRAEVLSRVAQWKQAIRASPARDDD